ncbi:hypothetical protein D3C71_2135640 [compost metagenome]
MNRLLGRLIGLVDSLLGRFGRLIEHLLGGFFRLVTTADGEHRQHQDQRRTDGFQFNHVFLTDNDQPSMLASR